MRLFYLSLLLIVFIAVSSCNSSNTAKSNESNTTAVKKEKKREEPKQELEGITLQETTGKKVVWELKAKKVSLSNLERVLEDITFKHFGENREILLTSKTGSISSDNKNLRLEGDVRLSSSDGIRFTTNSLDWDGKDETLSTNDFIKLQREDVTITGNGLVANPDLKTVEIKDKVKVIFDAKQQ